MPLTYQPFAEVPEIQELSKELRTNLQTPERVLSAVAGLNLIGAGLWRGGLTRLLMVGAGAALIHRGWTGHCAVYERLNIDKRHGSRGVPGNRGIKVEESTEINCPPQKLYHFWRNLEQLPKVMRHVESVRELSPKRSHWRVKAPAGQTVEWDAEIINDEEGRMLAWQSLPGAAVSNAGSVWFEPTSSGATRVKVAFEYDPPAGAVGAAVAHLLGSSPEAELQEDLAQFKQFAERELAQSAMA